MPESNPPSQPTQHTPPREDDSVSPDSTAGGGRRSRAETGTPTRIGRFEVRAVLGEGAFGRVYRGFDPELHRDVAIKVPHPNALTPDLRERFLREARAAATIHHPNVCPIYDVSTDGDVPHIVMRFIPGGTLAGLMSQRKKPFSAAHAAAIVRKIALGVAAAHANGVLHRDLKPANVLWDEAGREVLVTDFGLARIGGETQISRTGDILGTPAYMSPEQGRGRQDEVGPLADVYCLGVILYRMVTGELPFTGTVMEVLAQTQFDEPVLPSAVRPGLTAVMDDICLRAMAKKPADRYPGAKEFANALADFLRAGDKSPPSSSETAPSLRPMELPPDEAEALDLPSRDAPPPAVSVPTPRPPNPPRSARVVRWEDELDSWADELDRAERSDAAYHRMRRRRWFRARLGFLVRVVILLGLLAACVVVIELCIDRVRAARNPAVPRQSSP